MKKWHLMTALILVAVWLVWWQGEPERSGNETDDNEVVTKNEGTPGIPVRGLVVASKQQTIFAKQAGTVSAISVTEGTKVEAGAMLAMSTNPVLEAKITATSLGGDLRTAGSLRAGREGDLARDVAISLSREASTTADIVTGAQANRIEEATRTLATINETALIVIPSVLRFVQDNTSSMTALSRKQYNETLKALYGYAPDYFLTNRIAIPGAGEDVKSSLSAAQTSDDLLKATEVLRNSLVSLNQMLESSVSEFYDRDEIDSADPRYSEYIANRKQLAELLVSVDGAKANLVQSEDQAAGLTLSANEGALRAQYSEQGRTDIANLLASETRLAALLGSAESSVVAAEISLGLSKAPYSGTVSKVFVEEGTYVTPGTPLFSIIGEGGREIEVSVFGELIPLIMVGQKFVNNHGVELGVVERIAPQISGESRVFISITNEKINLGQVLEGKLELAEDEIAGQDTLRLVRRSELYFSQDGPQVVTVTGETLKVDIALDLGENLIIKTDSPIKENLKEKTGIVF